MKKKKIIISEILFGICSMILLLIFGNYLCAKQFQYKINGKHYLQIINDGFSDEEKVLTHTDNLKKTRQLILIAMKCYQIQNTLIWSIRNKI